MLAAHRIRPDCLILEVTESLLLENSAQLEQTFQELKMIGVRLALDDFGTGYSSLAYLHRFPDRHPQDRPLLRRTAGARGRRQPSGVDAVALARAILSLAEALGLDTVAEGIEHDAQRDTLLELGCKTGQGYSFGKAMPVDEVLRRRGHAPPQPARRQRAPARSNTRPPADSAGIMKGLTPVSGGMRLHDITPGMVLIIRPRASGRRTARKDETCVGFRPRALV